MIERYFALKYWAYILVISVMILGLLVVWGKKVVVMACKKKKTGKGGTKK